MATQLLTLNSNASHALLLNLPSAQGWRNRTLAVHERVNSRFLVLPGSLSIFTQITGVKYFSLL